MVNNEAYSGSYSKSPFNFQNMMTNYLEVTVDGQPVPNRLFCPNVAESDYVDSYLSLFNSEYGKKVGL